MLASRSSGSAALKRRGADAEKTKSCLKPLRCAVALNPLGHRASVRHATPVPGHGGVCSPVLKRRGTEARKNANRLKNLCPLRLCVNLSVIVHQSMAQLRFAASPGGGEHFQIASPEGSQGEVVDLHHFMDGMHLVEARQFQVVGDEAVGRPGLV